MPVSFAQERGVDTWLARALHERGQVELEVLQGLLFEAREGRPAGETLAQLLIARGILTPDEVEACLRGLVGGEGGTHRLLEPGDRIGGYTLGAFLGAGGMGTVFAAQGEGGGSYAIKALPLEGSDAEPILRFQREGQAQAAVDGHPNVVRVHSAGVSGGHAYLVMDLAPGGDLASRLREGPLDPRQAAEIVRQLALGLEHVHAHGVLHRDLKPANVLFGEGGAAQLVDFGIARLEGSEALTQTGAILGTPAYMPPEQARGEPLDRRADVYSLGAVLYACLTGNSPFAGEHGLACLLAVMNDPPPCPRDSRPELEPSLVEVCMRCLEKEPGARYPTALALAEALGVYLAGGSPPWRAPRGLAWVALVSVLLLLGALSFAFTSGRQGGPGDLPQEPGPAPPWTVPAGWRALGSLEQAVVSEATKELWEEPGRVAAPLVAARRGSPAAWLGAPEVLSGGRVSVHYTRLERALRAEHAFPASHVAGGRGQRSVFDLGEAGTGRVQAPNDLQYTILWVGAARWQEPALSFEAKLAEHVDGDVLRLLLEEDRLGKLGRALHLASRAGLAFIDSSARVAFQLDSAWKAVRFAPYASRERVVLGGVRHAKLGELALALRPPPTRVSLAVSEASVALRNLRVEGTPLEPDVPAWAALPATSSSSSLVGAAFSREGPGPGGPFVSLGSPDTGLVLELVPGALILRRGPIVLARRAVTGAGDRGWLSLERREDTISARVVAGPARLEFEVSHPLPLTALVPGYGSTSQRVRFSRVEAYAGPQDSARQSLDQSPDPLASLEPRLRPVDRWRLGALLLAQVSDPSFAETRFMGRSAQAKRVRRAQRAAELLEGAAKELDEPRGLDALARAFFARVVACDEAGAPALALRLTEICGVSSARARVDELQHHGRRAALIDRLCAGLGEVVSPALRAAATRSALVLAPEREGPVCYQLGRALIGMAKASSSPVRARALFEEARLVLTRARKAGADPPLVASELALVLMGSRRWGEALALWIEAEPAFRASWFVWLNRASCLRQLGRSVEALECTLGALAFSRKREDLMKLALHDAGRVRQQRPGLAAAALIALSHVLPQSGDLLRETAYDLARGVTGGGEEPGFAAYALTHSKTPLEAHGDGPAAILARAAAGDFVAREALPEVARRSNLIRHLALLDDDLVKLLRE